MKKIISTVLIVMVSATTLIGVTPKVAKAETNNLPKVAKIDGIEYKINIVENGDQRTVELKSDKDQINMVYDKKNNEIKELNNNKNVVKKYKLQNVNDNKYTQKNSVVNNAVSMMSAYSTSYPNHWNLYIKGYGFSVTDAGSNSDHRWHWYAQIHGDTWKKDTTSTFTSDGRENGFYSSMEAMNDKYNSLLTTYGGWAASVAAVATIIYTIPSGLSKARMVATVLATGGAAVAVLMAEYVADNLTFDIYNLRFSCEKYFWDMDYYAYGRN